MVIKYLNLLRINFQQKKIQCIFFVTNTVFSKYFPSHPNTSWIQLPEWSKERPMCTANVISGGVIILNSRISSELLPPTKWFTPQRKENTNLQTFLFVRHFPTIRITRMFISLICGYFPKWIFSDSLSYSQKSSKRDFIFRRRHTLIGLYLSKYWFLDLICTVFLNQHNISYLMVCSLAAFGGWHFLYMNGSRDIEWDFLTFLGPF